MSAPHSPHGSPSAGGCPFAAGACASNTAKVYGQIAEFDNVDDILSAANKARKAGYTKIDAHTPFPVHGIDGALGIKPTILPWICLCMGLVGMTTGILLTTYCMADWIPHPSWLVENFKGYRFLISGKPMLSIPAYIPPIFELTIMFSAYTAVFGMFLLNRLPTLSHPLFSSARFRRATQDRFFLAIEAEDAQFEAKQTQAFLQGMHGVLAVETILD